MRTKLKLTAKKFTVNLDFLTKIKDLDGVINIEQLIKIILEL